MAKDVNLIRIKADTNEYERSIKQAQKTWNDFTKGIGVNVGKLSGVGLAIGAVTTALKVAKDAFFKNEQQLDEWGRTVKSAEGLYSGFLRALNSGDISGYLRNMTNIVSAARAAYDAMDELGTFNAFNQINQEKSRTKFTEAMAEYREGSGSKESVQAAANALKDELKKRQEKEYNTYVKAVAETAQNLQISGPVLQRILEGSSEQYEQYKNLGLTGKGMAMMGGGYEKVAANEQEAIGQALRELNDTELKALQALGAQAQRTATEIENINKQTSRVLRGEKATTTSGGVGGTSTSKPQAEKYIPLAGSIDYMQAKVSELQTAFEKTADEAVRGKLYTELQRAKMVVDSMSDGMSMTLERSSGGTSFGSNLGDVSNVKIEGDTLNKLEELANAGEKADDSWGSALQSISGLGSALAGIEDPAVKVFSIVAEAIATVALSFSKALSKETKLGVWGWIAAAAAGTATMLSTIGAIKSATSGGFAQGGIVPGNSFSGDNLRTSDYGINSGELILNRAQQNSIASQLSNNGMGNMRLTATIKGTDIQLALNNTARQQGRGTYVTSR